MPNYLVEFYAPPGSVSPSPEYAELVLYADNEQQARLAADLIIAEERTDIASFLDWKSGYRDAIPSTVSGMLCSNIVPTAINRVSYTAAYIIASLGRQADSPRLCPVCSASSIKQVAAGLTVVSHEAGGSPRAVSEYACDACTNRFWFSLPSFKSS